MNCFFFSCYLVLCLDHTKECPPLRALTYIIRTAITPSLKPGCTPDLLDLLAHVDLVRARAVQQAREALALQRRYEAWRFDDACADDALHDSNRNTLGRPARRMRSRVACQSCNRRKVRCNVAQTSGPCSMCRRDSVECIILPRKKHR